MADPRLQWQQLNQAQPNVAGLLQQANDSFNDAANTAGEILGKYDNGIKERNDAEVRQELSALQTEDDLNNWLKNGGLNGRRVSDSVLELLSSGRDNILGYVNDRSITRDRDGRLTILQDTNSRVRTDWERGIAREDELASLSGALVGARTEGQDFGRDGTIPQSAFDRYISSTIGSESGGDPNARNPNSSATGLAQFTSGTWAEVMAKHPELGLTADGRTDPAQSEAALRAFTRDNMAFLERNGIAINEGTLYQAHFLGNGGARAVAEANGQGMMRDIMPSEVLEANPFLKSMSVAAFEAWAAEKGGANAPQASLTPNRDALENQLANSKYLSPSDIESILNSNDTFVNQGQSRVDEQNRQLIEETAATANQEVLDNPEINTLKDVRDAVFGDSRFTAAENESRYRQIQGLLGEDSSRLRPDVAEDPTTVAATVGAVEAASRAIDANPQTSLFASADRFRADDQQSSGEKLAAAVGLDGGNRENPSSFLGLGESGFDQSNLDRLIAQTATRNNVSEEVAAAAMARAFVNDPFGRNTLENRFDADKVDEIIKGIGQNDERDYNEARSAVRVMEQQLSTLRTNEQLLRAQLVQYPEGSNQRAAIQAQIDAGRQQMAEIEMQYSKATPRN